MPEAGLYDSVYNPDVLLCLANLSSDEVFTSPNVVNRMLDMLPQELFCSPETTFLDPACKTGVFLREIAKRLIKGLGPQMPDLQERVDHIFNNQLFGIAITELTAFLSRRSLYCSKYPNSEFSVTRFDDIEGNIRYRQVNHTWRNGRCVYCGVSRDTVFGAEERGQILESHAYEWIHTSKPEGIFNMRFDVIISNPPYQLDTAGAGRQARPIYNLFVEQAKKLNPRYITMIIPSRWFAGGMGLDTFRDNMMNDRHITKIVDFINSKDCFPQNSVSGGVCYFLWERNRIGDCEFTNVNGDDEHTITRPLNEFSVIVRYNKAVPILHKVLAAKEEKLGEIISPLMPYKLSTNYRGRPERQYPDDLVLHASDGITYIRPNEIGSGYDTVDKYKVLISKTSAEHAGEPGRDGRFKVLTSSLKVIGPKEVCTHSYFTIGSYDNREPADNLLSYLSTKFVRFLILLAMSSINLSKLVFLFVPMQDFCKPWTDEELYARYGLTADEVAFIESLIKPMDNGE